MDDFQPLGKNSIRLLRIRPELRNGHIACIVNQFDQVVPPYDALSYHWGDPESEREKIYVNDSLVDIHKALWEFLDQMQRSQDTENWIWTDFLCPNQKDHTEMGHQVPRMGHIYSNAERTISWLGCNNSCWASRRDGSSTHAEGLEEDMRLVAEKVAAEGAAIKTFFAQPMLRRWTDLMEMMFWAHYTNRPMGLSSETAICSSFGLPKATREVWLLSAGYIAEAVLNILFLPYWTRAWICQEVALAKKVILVFGKARLHFDDFLLIYKGYCYHMLKACGPETVELKVPIEARIAVQENNASFQQIVRWGRNCKASKTLDRIYGLLGLLERCSDGTHPLPTVLAQPIDYTRDSREVYWEIALTYHPISDEFRISGHRYKVSIWHWLDYLDELGRTLSCPFTRESLQYADNERATPLCREKAQIALSVLDVCKQAVMADVSIWVPDTRGPASSTSSWPAKACSRQLWSEPPYLGESPLPLQHYMQLILGTLLIDTTPFQGVDGIDQYQAAVIGLTMFISERRESVWNCIPHQSMEEPLEHNIEFRIAYKIGTASSQLPCSLLSTPSSAEPLQESHECQTSDRYLVIERTGWRLSLKLGDLRYTRGEAYWEGTLHVEY